MKISCTPISYINNLQHGKTQDDYFKLIAEAGADANDILDPKVLRQVSTLLKPTQTNSINK